MRRVTLIVVLAGIVVPVALAAKGDPQQRHTKADMALARAAAVHASDLGAGWKGEASTNTNQSRPRCASYNPDQSDLVETGKYDSPDFSRPDGTFVSSTTGVFRTAAMARTGYARVAVPALPRCFGQLFAQQIQKPNSITILRTGEIPFARIGDRSNAYRLTAAVKVGKTTVPVAIDMVLFDRGRTDVAMIFFSTPKAFPASFEQALAARVASRAR